jgi:hypothetical protein
MKTIREIWNVMILRSTCRRWNAIISKVLCRAYARGIINSQQLHILAKEFDPTQNGYVSRIGESGGDFCSFEVRPSEEDRRRWGSVGNAGA